MEDLLGELFWLDRHARSGAYLDQMAAADTYLARWALVELLSKGSSRVGLSSLNASTSAYAQMLLVRLAQDVHPLVRAEAHWHLSEVRPEGDPQPPSPIPDQAMAESELSFFAIKLHNGNFLAFSGRRDYDYELVGRIAAYLYEHPITAGFDFEAYWSAFAAWP